MSNHRIIGNPSIAPLFLFGVALSLYGIQFWSPDTTGAAVFAVLIAGGANVIASGWSLVRNEGYLAGIHLTFGAYLVGLSMYFLSIPDKAWFTPTGLGWFLLALVVPTVAQAIPALRLKLVPLSIALGALVVALVAGGVGNIVTSDALLKVGGGAAFVVALALWWIAYGACLVETGLKGVPAAQE
jgi:succinate-acetate transporter protein